MRVPCMSSIGVFAVGFVVSVALLPVARALSWRLGMLDQPNGRKVHRQPTPLLGGLAIYGGFCAALALLARDDKLFLLSVLLSTYLVVIGFIDDRHDIHARYRLAMQLMAAAAVVMAGIHVSLGAGAFLTGLAGLLTVLWLLGMINSTKCVECIEGAAATYAFVSLASFYLLAMAHGRHAVAALAAALCGAVLGFLLCNFPPASMFMGDLGSTFLGFMLGILSVASGPRADAGFRFPVEVLVLAPIAYDFILVHVRRYRGGIRSLRDLLSSTGKDHLPHRLLAMPLTAREVDAVLGLLAGVWGMTAFLFVRGWLAAAGCSAMVALVLTLFGEGILWRVAHRRRAVLEAPQRVEQLALSRRE